MIGDVVGSDLGTGLRKVEGGQALGERAPAATFNALDRHDFPFVLGGDGATLALPVTETDVARPAFAVKRAMARLGFGLNHRIGAVSAASLDQDGRDLGMARIRLADHSARLPRTAPGSLRRSGGLHQRLVQARALAAS